MLATLPEDAMQALIIDAANERLDRHMIAYMEAGLQVTGTSNIEVAETCLSQMPVDLLMVHGDSVGDALGDLIGMAEDGNPRLVSLLLSSVVRADTDDLPDHFPSLHCVLGESVPSALAARLGLASLMRRPLRFATFAPDTPRSAPAPMFRSSSELAAAAA